MKAITALVCLTIAATPQASIAQSSDRQSPIGDASICTAVGASTRELGEARFREIDTYIRSVFEGADASYSKRGRAQIIPRLSYDGLENLLSVVFVECRDNPRRTIKVQALRIYEGVRAMQRDLGVKGL